MQMFQKFRDDKEDLRCQSRMYNEKIFTLPKDQYDRYLADLNGSDTSSLIAAMDQFACHYKNNKFECNDQTHLILTIAVSAINDSENQITELAKNSFYLLSNAIKNASNGLSFIIETNALEVLQNNIFNTESPFFDQAIMSISHIVGRTPDICKTIYNNFPITFFFNLLKNYDEDNSPEVPYHALSILYYYTKYRYLDDEQYYQMIEFLNNILNGFYTQITRQDSIKLTNYEIICNCVKILTIIFEKSAIYHTKYTSNFITIFNQILQLNIRECSCIRKLVSSVLHAFIQLLRSGSALEDPGIDIKRITSLAKKAYPIIQPVALDCINIFIPSTEKSIQMLLQTKVFYYFRKIIKSGTCNAKDKVLSIYDTIMKNGTNEEKAVLLKSEIIAHMIFYAKEVNDDLYKQIIILLDSMLKLEATLQHDFQIHSAFLESGGVQLVEEKCMYGSDIASEISQQFINDHIQEGE